MSAALPFVVLLDLDGTVIGDITFQACEWEIVRRYDPSRVRLFRSNLVSYLRNTQLIRPQLAYFINTLRRKAGQHVEFFIYTASEQKWASFIVPCVEEALGVRFNRPLLTRAHVMHMSADGLVTKSLSKVFPTLQRALKSKYPLWSRKHISSTMLLIDNNRTLDKKERANLIQCPTYAPRHVCDILRLVSDEQLRKHMMSIASHLSKYGLFPKLRSHTLSYSEFMLLYMQKLYEMMQMQTDNSSSSSSKSDTYWKKLAHAMVQHECAWTSLTVGKTI